MNKRLKLILSTFTNQKSQNDCGIACLASICKYAGVEAPSFEVNGPLSLLQLQKFAELVGLYASCVRMDIDALRQNTSPCILHTVNNTGDTHFIVHYPFKNASGLHLVGDPDGKIEPMPEVLLLEKWVSRTALYFEDIKPRKGIGYRFFPWSTFVQFRFIPRSLWLSIPFLNVAATVMGLAVSLLIQKAVDPVFIGGESAFFRIMFILLMLILLAKCLINYLRQTMLVTSLLKMDRILALPFRKSAYRSFKESSKLPGHFYLNSLADVQKIRHAVSLLIGVVCSDGIVLAVMMGGLFYFQPMLVVVQIAAFAGQLLIVDHFMPLMLILAETAQPTFDSSIANIKEMKDAASGYKLFSLVYLRLNEEWSAKSKAMSGLANKINCLFEGLSGINLIVILYLCIGKLKTGQISYENFLLIVLLCYGIMILMAKVCNQLFPIVQGAQRLKENLDGNPV